MSGTDAKKRRLGRGLSGMLGEPVAVEVPPGLVVQNNNNTSSGEGSGGIEGGGGRRVEWLGVGEIQAGAGQPRRVFDEVALQELAESIKSAGVMQPILVRKRDPLAPNIREGIRYEIVAGERRWRAAQMAGLATIPALVAELSDEQAAAWALIENVQREDLTALEKADGVRSLCVLYGLTQVEASERLGMSRSAIANLMRLTEIELEIRTMLEDGVLSAGHCKVLLSLEPGRVRLGMARRAAAGSWSVRRLEVACGIDLGREAGAGGAGAGGGSGGGKVGAGRDAGGVGGAGGAGLEDLEKQIGEQLGTRVALRTSAGGKRGSVVLWFYDLDHFDGLMQKMGVQLR